ncbi:hypothetical protein ACWCSH_20660, partial [Streptosporangium sp. NPDC001682]
GTLFGRGLLCFAMAAAIVPGDVFTIFPAALAIATGEIRCTPSLLMSALAGAAGSWVREFGLPYGF